MTESTNQTDMKMSNKTKTQDKNSKISEIDEHIRRNFDIKKVGEVFAWWHDFKLVQRLNDEIL